MDLKYELELLQQTENIVGCEVIPEAFETKARLFSLIPEDSPEEVVQHIDNREGKEETIGVAPRVDSEICQYTGESNERLKRRKMHEGARLARGKANKTKLLVEECEQEGKFVDSQVFHRNGKSNESTSAQAGREKEGSSDKSKVFQVLGYANKTKYVSGGRETQETRDETKVFPVIRKTNNPKSAHRVREKGDNSYNGATGNEANRKAQANQISIATGYEGTQAGQTIAANQPTCSFRCPVCSRDFVFTNMKTAPEKFSHHVRFCDPNKSRKTSLRMKNVTTGSDSLDYETQVTMDEVLPVVSPIDPDELGRGSRVIVITKGEKWKATIRKHHVKKGKPGFMIHYDGKKNSVENWVPTASVVDFISSDV